MLAALALILSGSKRHKRNEPPGNRHWSMWTLKIFLTS